MIFSSSYTVKQYAAGYLTEVEVSKLISSHLFCKILGESKTCSYLIQIEGNNFCFFFSPSFVVKQYVASHLIEVEASNFVF